MSKKDYELIAGVLRDLEPAIDNGELQHYIADAFARALAGTNPRFDRSRFIAACMGEDSTDSAGRKVSYSK